MNFKIDIIHSKFFDIKDLVKQDHLIASMFSLTCTISPR